MISQKNYSKGLPFAHLKKEKMIFYQNWQEHHIAKKGTYTTKF
jgi:hypothetical protein